MVKLFVFDMGGVVVRNFDIIPEICSILNISRDELINSHNDDFYSMMEGRSTTVEFWEKFSRNSGIPVTRDLWSELFKPELDSSVLALINRLKKEFPVVCGTNSLKEHWNIHRERGDYNCFDRVYASNIMGVAKPSEDFFIRILESEKVRPEETVFIDDFPENIEASEKIGINSFLFNGVESLVPRLEKLLSITL